MSAMTALCDLSAVELRRLIGQKGISPVELLESCLERIAATNPAVNAMVTLDEAGARQAAKRAEQAVMQGEPLGLLHGLPLGIKDLAVTGGLRTTFGSQLFADDIPAQDERGIADLRAAGGIVLGKTNTPEFGAGANTTNAVFGPTGNPYDPARTCGGSSGGSGVVLACGMVPLASGSDHGGSLRIPATFNGVVGMRPTPGMVASERRGLGWFANPVNGPMARTVDDLALMLAAMVSDDPLDPLARPVGDRAALANPAPVDLAGVRVRFSEDLGFAPIEARMRACFQAIMARLAPFFAATDLHDPDMNGADRIFDVQRALYMVAGHGARVSAHRDRLGSNIVSNVEQGWTMSLADVAETANGQTRIYRNFVRYLSDWDVLICPNTGVPPFPVDQLYVDVIDGRKLATYYHWFAMTYGLTLTAHPIIALPCGTDYTGIPFGLQIVGKPGQEAKLLGIARALEQVIAADPALVPPKPDLAKLVG